MAKLEMKMNWEMAEVKKVGKERGQCCVAIGAKMLESVHGGIVKYYRGDAKWGQMHGGGA